MANKYRNLFYGQKLVVELDNTVNQWAISESIYNMFSNIENNTAFSFGIKTLKEYSLANADGLLNKVYRLACDYISVDKPEKNTVIETVKTVNNLFNLLTGEEKDYVFASEWDLVFGCIAIQASVKSLVSLENKRTKFVALASFKKAFWNAYYNITKGADFVTLSNKEVERRQKEDNRIKAQEKARAKKQARAEKRAEKEAKKLEKEAKKAEKEADEFEDMIDSVWA